MTNKYLRYLQATAVILCLLAAIANALYGRYEAAIFLLLLSWFVVWLYQKLRKYNQ